MYKGTWSVAAADLVATSVKLKLPSKSYRCDDDGGCDEDGNDDDDDKVCDKNDVNDESNDGCPHQDISEYDIEYYDDSNDDNL